MSQHSHNQGSSQDGQTALRNAVVRLGFPAEFSYQLADVLRSDHAMARMASYLRQARPSSVEQIVDEAFAIASDRDRWIEQKRSEYANARLTEFYNRPHVT